jgi:hypothetical protein
MSNVYDIKIEQGSGTNFKEGIMVFTTSDGDSNVTMASTNVYEGTSNLFFTNDRVANSPAVIDLQAQIDSATSGLVIYADNGLNKDSGGTIGLGGTLTNAVTDIEGSGSQLLRLGGNAGSNHLGQLAVNATSIQLFALDTFSGGDGHNYNANPGTTTISHNNTTNTSRVYFNPSAGVTELSGQDHILIFNSTSNTATFTDNNSSGLVYGGDYEVNFTGRSLITKNLLDSTTSGIYNALDTKIDLSEKGAINGVATLDGSGKIPSSQLTVDAVEYKGTWNPDTNTPTLTNGVGNTGDLYVASTSGTTDFGAGNITFKSGDWVIYNGSEWEKSVNSNLVDSVFGRTGVVTAQSGDYTSTLITNSSTVTGATVTNALDNLQSDIDSLESATTGINNTLNDLQTQINVTGTSGVTELNDLSDVNTGLPVSPTNADDGKMLFYDFSTGEWITDDTVTHGSSVINGKKASAGTIAKGKPVYLVGFDNDLHTVEEANATSSLTMPVIGFAAETMDDTNSKHIMTFGKLTGIDTSLFSLGEDLYMDVTTGSLTATRPTGSNTLIQRIAKVLKVDAVSGQILIFNTARTAGLPNLTQNNFWVGDSNDIPQETDVDTVKNLLDIKDHTTAGYSTITYVDNADTILQNQIDALESATTGINNSLNDLQTQINNNGTSSDLQTAYNNSTSPEIITSDSGSAVAFRRGTTGGDTDDVIEVENGAGTQTFSVRGDGTVVASSGDFGGNITVGGTVDGRDIATDGAYLDSLVGLTDGDKGDITVSDSGSNWTIDNDAVTYAKMQNVSSNNVFLGNNSGAGGVVDELTASEARTILNVADGANNYTHPNHTGEVTSTGDGATVVDKTAITAKPSATVASGDLVLISDVDDTNNLKQVTAQSIADLGGGGVSDGDKGDITVSDSGSNWTIDNDAVTYAKIQNVSSNNVFLGNDNGAGQDVQELTASEARTILNVADGANNYSSPLSTKGALFTHTGAIDASLIVGDNDSTLVARSSESVGLVWRKNNITATTAPTATDDSTSGYEVGSIWIDTTNNNVFTCSDATASAAVWVNTGSQVQSKTHTFGDYDSANYTESFAHGLGSDPDSYKVELECTSANLNYAVGDKIQLGDGNSLTEQNTADRGFHVITDGTNVTYIQAQHTNIVILNKTTGAWGNASYANGWRLKITAYKFGQNVTYEDPNAIHDNVANEITAITEKTTIDPDDELLIEDSEDSNNKKSVKVSTFKDELTKSIYIEDPIATDDIGIWEPGVAITITKVVHKITGTTNVVFNINHSGGTDLWAADKTNTGTRVAETVFTDATCTADNYIRYQATSISGTPTSMEITITYTED